MSAKAIADDRHEKCEQAFKKGRGHIYAYGFQSIAQEQGEFYAKKKHLKAPLAIDYEPNPYLYQYDLEVHIFLNYDRLVKKEKELVEQQIRESKKAGLSTDQLNFKLEFIEQYGTGIKREEHFWHAVQFRWPTKVLADGKHQGAFIREPWAEDFISTICKYEYVNMFGGSGQGKTHRALAFMCILWDHFIDTEMGGRCRFSTVSEAKIKDSAWPYLQRIYKQSRKDISLYCGRGIVFGEYTIARPHDKKGGSSIKGVLLSNRNDSSVVDKITGSHGHPVGIYHIDELQSTPEAPVEASPNFLQNCQTGWITASGNYDKDNDSLGKNVKPVNGWSSVDTSTHLYEGVNMLGIKCGCIHYNNNLSPAFDGEGFKKWGHILPTKIKRDARYPTETSRRSTAYRRLWIGWREANATNEAVLNLATLREMGCTSKDPNWDPAFPVTHFWSFDSAPTSKDRNILLHAADGIDKDTQKWKLHLYEAIAIRKIEQANEYLELASEEILKYSRLWRVKPGNGILDWTNITGLPERLKEKEFDVKWLVYNQAPPDGKRRDIRNGLILPPVLLDANSEKFAHTEASNMISMGALIIQNLVLNGQLTGLHDEFINERNSTKSYEEELCLRRFIEIPNRTNGTLTALEPKHSKSGNTGFTKTHGFSPDVLDTIFQAGAFVAMHRGMIPGYLGGDKAGYQQDNGEHVEREYFQAQEKNNEEELLMAEHEKFSYVEDDYFDADDLILSY